MRAKRWPLVGAACALVAGAVLIAPAPSGAVSTPAPKASVFMNPEYVDTVSFHEGDNVLTTLLDGGVTVTEFTGITAPDFTAALDGADVLVIPELETQEDPGVLAADMGPDSRAVVKEWVDAGGRIIVFGSSSPWVDVDMIFGTAYEGDEYNEVCDTESPPEEVPAGATNSGLASTSNLESDDPCVKQPVAATTEFAESPDTLVYNDDTSTTPINLPAATKTIYTWINGEAAVTAIPQGHGSIVFLAWDWFGAYPDLSDGAAAAVPSDDVDTGWFTVLLAATDATVAVGDATVDEGVTAPFTISLPNGPVAQDVVVEYATTDGTAVAGTDYAATAGTAVIPVGQTSVVVEVPTLVRAGAQGARTFSLDIDAPYFAQVADPSGVGTINDVPEPTTTTTTTVAPRAAAAVVVTPRFTG